MCVFHFLVSHKQGKFFCLTLLIIGSVALGSDYDDQMARAFTECNSLNEDAYQTGLAFNPDGYRSYFERSQCFQTIAVRFRNDSYCALVKERSSIISSSWGYSEENCSKLVSQGKRADSKTLNRIKQAYQNDRVQLQYFIIEPNGNGRDYDIIPKFSDGYSHAYHLEFKILNTENIKNKTSGALLDSSGFHLGGADENIRIYAPQEQILKNFPQFIKGSSYLVRATLTLNVGMGHQNGIWSDYFIEKIFPVKERSQLMETEITF